jgi:hypothetical protein
MQPVHSHYDNLKVSRTAPPEVIRAAYKSLSQKYHPDFNAGSAESVRIMAIINSSYEVLSNPSARQDHDVWLREQERLVVSPQPQMKQPNVSAPSSAGFVNTVKNWVVWKPIVHFWNNGRLYVFVGFCALIWWGSQQDTKPPKALGEYAREYNPPVERFIRPVTAPNGQAWPQIAAYVAGYKQFRSEGRSTLTVDNRQNDSDVFVKLVFIGSTKASPVRHFYIPAGQAFTVKSIKAGDYDLRYRDLGSGKLTRSEAFTLVEEVTETGTRFSNMSLTLYKVRDGNSQSYSLSENDF